MTSIVDIIAYGYLRDGLDLVAPWLRTVNKTVRLILTSWSWKSISFTFEAVLGSTACIIRRNSNMTVLNHISPLFHAVQNGCPPIKCTQYGSVIVPGGNCIHFASQLAYFPSPKLPVIVTLPTPLTPSYNLRTSKFAVMYDAWKTSISNSSAPLKLSSTSVRVYRGSVSKRTLTKYRLINPLGRSSVTGLIILIW